MNKFIFSSLESHEWYTPKEHNVEVELVRWFSQLSACSSKVAHSEALPFVIIYIYFLSLFLPFDQKKNKKKTTTDIQK